MKPTAEQLRDFFRSEIFREDQLLNGDYDLAIAEFYHRFYSAPVINDPTPDPRKWQTTHVRKYQVKAFLRTKDGQIHKVIFKKGPDSNLITDFDGAPWDGDHNLLDVWQEYYQSDHSSELARPMAESWK